MKFDERKLEETKWCIKFIKILSTCSLHKEKDSISKVEYGLRKNKKKVRESSTKIA